MRKDGIYRRSIIFALYIFAIIAPLVFAGCPREEMIQVRNSCGKPGSPAIQLLPTVGLSVLRDTFCELGYHDLSNPKPQLTIDNNTNATLNILLYSENGTKYDLSLAQGRDNTWVINSGTYRTELIIPGYPSMSGGNMTLVNHNKYRWEIRRSEL